MKLSELKTAINPDCHYGDINHIISVCGDKECSFFKKFKTPRDIRIAYPDINNQDMDGLQFDNSGFLIKVVSDYEDNENVVGFDWIVYGDE